MWFLIGFVTLVAAFLRNFFWRTQANWKFDSAKLDGVAYDVGHVYGRKPLGGEAPLLLVRIGVRGLPEKMDFAMHATRIWDRWANRLGISAERQLNDQAFDDAVYLESDNPALIKVLTDQPSLRVAMHAVFSTQRAYGIKVKRIVCRSRRLWCEFKPEKKFSDPAPLAAKMLVPLLHQLGAALHEQSLLQAERRDPTVLRAVVLLSLSTASIVLGLFAMIRVSSPPPLIDPWGMFRASLIPSLTAFAVFFLLAAWMLGRSSRTHLVLAELLLVGGIGFVLTGHAIMREINIDSDQEVGQDFSAHKIHITQYRHRGQSTYYLSARDWPPPLAHVGQLQIDSETYAALSESTRIQNDGATIHVMPGALGFAWVAYVDPERIPAPAPGG